MAEERDNEGYLILKRKYGSLHSKYSYLTKRDVVLDRITEYDLRSANTSALRRAKILKTSTLDDIDRLPKQEREVVIGKMIRENKEIHKVIQKQILRAKFELFRSNGLIDDDVLAIKNDAVYVIGRKLKNTVFGPMEFRAKNTYACYINLEKLEFYYDRINRSVQISGINDSILAEEDHIAGMEQFFVTVMEYLVMDRREGLTKYLLEFVDDYKRKNLPVVYYRELSKVNAYRTTFAVSADQDYVMCLDTATDDDRPMINGVYNYKKFVLPFVQRFL